MARRPQSPPPPQRFRHPALDYRPPLTLQVIRWTLMAIIAFAVISATYTAYWFYVARAFRDGLPQWIEQMAGPGATLTYRQLEISGYPLRFRIILHEPSLNAPQLPLGGGTAVQWRTAQVVAMMAPWSFSRFTVSLDGTHDLTINGRASHVAADTFTLETLMHGDGLPERARIDAANLRISDARGPDPVWSLGLAHVVANRAFPAPDAVGAGATTLSTEFQLGDIALPARLDSPLGRTVAKLNGEAHVTGKLDDATSFDALQRWQVAGGTLEFNVRDSRYGPLGLAGSGTFTFDETMQPLVAATARVEGLFTAIDLFRDRNLIRSRDASMAKVVLGVLAKPGENGGPPSVSLPFTLQGGKLSAGPVPLMDVPPIPWDRDSQAGPVLRQ